MTLAIVAAIAEAAGCRATGGITMRHYCGDGPPFVGRVGESRKINRLKR